MIWDFKNINLGYEGLVICYLGFDQSPSSYRFLGKESDGRLGITE